MLPVDNACPWWRPNKIVAATQHHPFGCKTFKGKGVENYRDLVGCLQEADCETTGRCGRHGGYCTAVVWYKPIDSLYRVVSRSFQCKADRD